MIIDKSFLSARINKLKPIVPGKMAPEVMQGILMKEGSIIAYNLEVAMRTKITDTDETFIIPQTAIDLIPKLPDGDIELKYENDQLYINASGIKSKHATLSPNEYPALPGRNGEQFIIDGAALSSILHAISHAIAVDQSRPSITGVLIESAGEQLELTATDGHRVSIGKIPFDGAVSCIIPKQAVQRIVALNILEEIEITCDKNTITFDAGEYSIMSRLLEEAFPNVKSIFKNSHKHTTSINKYALIEIVERASLASDIIRVKIEGNEATIIARSKLSEHIETMGIEEEISGIDMAFSAKKLLETIKSVDGNTIKAQTDGNLTPLFLIGEAITSLILPRRERE